MEGIGLTHLTHPFLLLISYPIPSTVSQPAVTFLAPCHSLRLPAIASTRSLRSLVTAARRSDNE